MLRASKVILIDQDGPLAQLTPKLYAMVQKRYPNVAHIIPNRYLKLEKHYPKEMQASIVALYTQPGFFLGLEPVQGARDALEEMVHAGHEVRICTSPLTAYTHCVLEKYQWVEKYFGHEWTRRIILTKDKTLVRGDILIDDKPEITGAMSPTWKHVLYDAPYNRNREIDRLHRWSDWKMHI